MYILSNLLQHQLTHLTPLIPRVMSLEGMIVVVIMLLVVWQWYCWFVRELNIRKENDVIQTSRNRRVGKVPNGYPTGWYRLCFTSEVPTATAKSFPAFGSSLLVFRGEDGVARVIDPYCAHLGADMSDGKVVGNCIECPFHGWNFDGSGKCTKIPYSSGTIPSTAAVPAWHCKETHGMVLVWYDEAKREPFWQPPLADYALRFHGKTEHRVACNIQEIPENGADVAHLTYLHGAFMFEWLPMLSHEWFNVSWTAGGEGREHLADMTLSQRVKIWGKTIPGTRVDVIITQCALGFVQLQFLSPFGRVVVIECVTPEHSLLQRSGHVVLAEPQVPRFVAKFFLRSLIRQFERDVPIWNKKTFVHPPLAVKDDGPLLMYRRWVNKLYPNKDQIAAGAKDHVDSQTKCSPHVPQCKQDNIEW